MGLMSVHVGGADLAYRHRVVMEKKPQERLDGIANRWLVVRHPQEHAVWAVGFRR